MSKCNFSWETICGQTQTVSGYAWLVVCLGTSWDTYDGYYSPVNSPGRKEIQHLHLIDLQTRGISFQVSLPKGISSSLVINPYNPPISTHTAGMAVGQFSITNSSLPSERAAEKRFHNSWWLPFPVHGLQGKTIN